MSKVAQAANKIVKLPAMPHRQYSIVLSSLAFHHHRIAAWGQVDHEPLFREREETSRPSSQNVWNFLNNLGFELEFENSIDRIGYNQKTFCSG